jgi:transposase-like protein
MRCPVCNKSDRIIKSGKRKTKKGIVQKVLCRRCGRYFSSSIHPYSRYPDNMIFDSMELYNHGRSIEKIQEEINEIYGIEPPRRTIYSWIRRYVRQYGLYALRGRRSDDDHDPVVVSTLNGSYSHEWRYHSVKLRMIKCRWSGLHSHLRSIEEECRIPVLDKDNEDSLKVPLNRQLLKGPDYRYRDMVLLAEDVKGVLDRSKISDFFLFNHPHCVAANLPLLEMNSERMDCPISNGIHSIDLLFVDQDRIGLVDILKTKKEMEERIPLMLLARNVMIKETGLTPSRIYMSFISDERYFELDFPDDQL